MSREEVQKLLGGYATGTLTAEEQQALFEAALDDQELFDTLAREQGLRDLLRDPAAKAELLAALDDRPARGWWAWLRRPAVAGLAMAGVAAIAVVVWQGSRKPVALPAAPAPASAIVAELRPRPAEPAAEAPAPAQPKPDDEKRRSGAVRPYGSPPAAPRGAARDLVAEPPVVAQAKPPELNLSQQNAQNAPAPPPQALNQMNQTAQSKYAATAETIEVKGALVADARALFYQQLPLNSRNSFAALDARSRVAGSGAPPDEKTSAKKEAPRAGAEPLARMAAGMGGAAVLHPGIRCSILRGDREVDLSTPLYAGESVRLRLTPNADGFLYVFEGEGDSSHLVASGPAQRFKPFETPALLSDAPGQKQFRVTLALLGAMKSMAAFGGATRADLLESTAGREPATYVVLRDAMPAAQQVEVPITLTWR